MWITEEGDWLSIELNRNQHSHNYWFTWELGLDPMSLAEFYTVPSSPWLGNITPKENPQDPNYIHKDKEMS